MPISVHRFVDGPLITPSSCASIGGNINGPSAIMAPGWVENPLGQFYLYFAHHRGRHVRLTYSDTLEGPWTIHKPGCLDVKDSLFVTEDIGTPEEMARNYTYAHVASPDVHVHEDSGEVRMYFHGLMPDGSQVTRLAVSDDGLTFNTRPEVLGTPYFRAFPYRGHWYALAMPDKIMWSEDGVSSFRYVCSLGDATIRHSAVLVSGDTLHVFFSRIGDCPERILHGRVNLRAPFDEWQLHDVEEVLAPEHDWEGGNLPVNLSVAGEAPGPVHQLRDPGILKLGGNVFLFYSLAGESGIGAVRLEVSEG